uniref:tyrosine--tRNA ligase n=1 Tax=Meloidogyne enterolobii TaxID=390850 RepID=A0A6V7V2E9_MELEN|nr:unnamed protein product [Meloidogyne enterolobii]
MTVCFNPFHKVYAEKSFCRCGGSRACRAERRPPLRYGRASEASTTAAKHGHRVAKTMPGLPSVAAQKQFFQRRFNWNNNILVVGKTKKFKVRNNKFNKKILTEITKNFSFVFIWYFKSFSTLLVFQVMVFQAFGIITRYLFGDLLSDFTLKMYQAVSVVTRDQTSLIPEANTVGCHLCPIYFALDIFYGNYDIVLIGPKQKEFADLALKINKELKREDSNMPAFLILPEIIGTDGLRMSATKPDFHLNINDGLKKIRQKIGKSFCEPGNLDKNVALELCKKIVFPFADYLKWREKYIVGGDEFKDLTIKRSPENGGNLIVKNYQELESLFLSLNLHPADLKAFLVEQLDAFYFEPIRNNKKIM